MITYRASCRIFAMVVLVFGFALLVALGFAIDRWVPDRVGAIILAYALGAATVGMIQIAFDIWRSGDTL